MNSSYHLLCIKQCVSRWCELRVELLETPGGLKQLLEGHPFGDNDVVMGVYYHSLGLVRPLALSNDSLSILDRVCYVALGLVRLFPLGALTKFIKNDP
jgi:hypothetical protein